MPAVPNPVYRLLPAVHQLAGDERLRAVRERFGRDTVVDACRTALADLRRRITAERLGSEATVEAAGRLVEAVLAVVERAQRPAYPPVVNATGVLLHTNLGRAPLPDPPPSLHHAYLALEYDLESGTRGQRLTPLARRLAELCGAESGLMVNNNAAALLLLLADIARDREVIVARSQLIEIGGSFRLPALMEASGARLVEVGCTNRVHLHDYEAAVCDATAAILVAHRSNFRIVGFTTEPPLAELAGLAHRWNLPLLMDQGSGCLHDLVRWGLPHEPTVTELLADGADVVCFSGDKLLGGPQAGLLVGAARWVEPLGRHPLYRALRPDKTALVWMDRVIAAHRDGRLTDLPLYALLETPLATVKRRARALARRLAAAGVPANALAVRSVLGGGTTPDATLASWGVGVAGGQALADALRRANPPVVARLEDDVVVLDLRTVLAGEDRALQAAVAAAYQGVNDLQAGGR